MSTKYPWTDGTLLIWSHSVGNTAADVYPSDGRPGPDRRCCVCNLSRGAQQVSREPLLPVRREPVEDQISKSMQSPRSSDDDQTVASTVSELREMFGDDWSFDIVYHASNRSLTEVRGELRANGVYASETGTNENTEEGYSAGKRLRAAAEQSFVRCAQKLLHST